MKVTVNEEEVNSPKDYLESLKFDIDSMPSIFNDNDKSYYEVLELIESYMLYLKDFDGTVTLQNDYPPTT